MTGQLRLDGFDAFCIELVRQMETDGWTGRVSAKGHAIMRSPDGEATCSVSPKIGEGRRRANLGSDYRRWKRVQEAVEEATENVADDLAWYRDRYMADQHRIAELAAEVEEWKRLAQEAIDLL